MPPLDPDALGEALRGNMEVASSGIGRRIEYHGSLPSTSDRARELAAGGEPEGTVVIAGEQTRGRGRFDRNWHSPVGLGLYMSIILRPRAAGSEAPLFGLLAAVGVGSALGARIKWPNDLMVSGKKIAGILTEARSHQAAIRDLVIGIGVNLNQEVGDFPSEIRGSAISLRMIHGQAVESLAVAEAILAALGRWYTLWSTAGREPVLDRFRAMADDIAGRRVRFQDGGRTRTGITDGITSDGALRIRSGDGGSPEDVVEIRFGEVSRIEEA